MASKPVVDAVESRLAEHWDKSLILGVNLAGETPRDGAPYLVVQYPVANEEQVSVGAPGANLWREEGAFRIVIHSRQGKGVATGLEWADELRALFRGKHFGGVETFAPSPPSDGERSGNYYVTAIAVPYQYDHVG